MIKYLSLLIFCSSFSLVAKAGEAEKSLLLAFYKNQSSNLGITTDAATGTFYIGDASITCQVNFAEGGSCDASSLRKLRTCKASAVTCSPANQK